MIETDTWPVISARWYTKYTGVGRRRVRLIVIHDMEAPEKGDTAESVARYFAGLPASTKASAHVCVDNNSVVQCVRDNDIAYAAPGANNDGIQIEMAGYGNQTRGQWMDTYGRQLLGNAASVVAQYLLKYELPATHLTNAELQTGQPGIIGHVQASQVYKASDHTDPGPSFPWDYFMKLVAAHYEVRRIQFTFQP